MGELTVLPEFKFIQPVEVAVTLLDAVILALLTTFKLPNAVIPIVETLITPFMVVSADANVSPDA